MQTPYSQIMEFCKSKHVSELQSKILLHKFYKDYYEIIDNYKKKENKEPTASNFPEVLFHSTMYFQNPQEFLLLVLYSLSFYNYQ